MKDLTLDIMDLIFRDDDAPLEDMEISEDEWKKIEREVNE